MPAVSDIVVRQVHAGALREFAPQEGQRPSGRDNDDPVIPPQQRADDGDAARRVPQAPVQDEIEDGFGWNPGMCGMMVRMDESSL